MEQTTTQKFTMINLTQKTHFTAAVALLVSILGTQTIFAADTAPTPEDLNHDYGFIFICAAMVFL